MMTRLEKLRNNNRGLMEELAREGFAVNPVSMLQSLLQHVIETVFGPVGSPEHQAFALAWEIRAAEQLARIQADVAEQKAALARMKAQARDAVTSLNGRVRDKRAVRLG